MFNKLRISNNKSKYSKRSTRLSTRPNFARIGLSWDTADMDASVNLHMVELTNQTKNPRMQGTNPSSANNSTKKAIVHTVTDVFSDMNKGNLLKFITTIMF